MHSKLVELAAQWLKRKCPVVITECVAGWEIPDAIGWRGTHSTVIECKASASDFRADLAKPHRRTGSGMGAARYYMALPGVIPLVALPAGWGLLEVTSKTIVTRRKSGIFQCDRHSEVCLLLSALRRVGSICPKGVSIRCYTHETQNKASLSIQRPDNGSGHNACAL